MKELRELKWSSALDSYVDLRTQERVSDVKPAEPEPQVLIKVEGKNIATLVAENAPDNAKAFCKSCPHNVGECAYGGSVGDVDAYAIQYLTWDDQKKLF